MEIKREEVYIDRLKELMKKRLNKTIVNLLCITLHKHASIFLDCLFWVGIYAGVKCTYSPFSVNLQKSL